MPPTVGVKCAVDTGRRLCNRPGGLRCRVVRGPCIFVCACFHAVFLQELDAGLRHCRPIVHLLIIFEACAWARVHSRRCCSVLARVVGQQLGCESCSGALVTLRAGCGAGPFSFFCAKIFARPCLVAFCLSRPRSVDTYF